MFRKTELWLPVKAPIGKNWLDHLVKVPTNTPAKNTTFYQLKDCPYTWYSPSAEVSFDSNLREKASEAVRAKVEANRQLHLQIGSNLMDPNSLSCSVSVDSQHLLALGILQCVLVCVVERVLFRTSCGHPVTNSASAAGFRPVQYRRNSCRPCRAIAGTRW